MAGLRRLDATPLSERLKILSLVEVSYESDNKVRLWCVATVRDDGCDRS